MRIIVILAILIGAFWAIDAYEYDGYYSTAVLHQIKHDADKISQEVSNVLTGHGG